MKTEDLLSLAGVVPVLAIEDASHAEPLAVALAQGGLRVVELTLRTRFGLDAVAAMKRAAPNLIVGMGTVRTPHDVQKSVDAGAEFIVTPGSTPALLQAIAESGLPALPAAATASEAMVAQSFGFDALKFFPAERSGGVAWLKDIAGPLPDIQWCPSGGIGIDQVAAYFALPNVACVGGSWVARQADIAAGNWDQITENAKKACELAQRLPARV
jgi:2-dehydro-3-deoxyphosphogluconate aldolase/(4S)-4-hydroxy-2-oxoglutarate aldolase